MRKRKYFRRAAAGALFCALLTSGAGEQAAQAAYTPPNPGGEGIMLASRMSALALQISGLSYFTVPEGGSLAPTETPEQEQERKYLGEFTLTAYCACPKCCGKWSNEQNPTTASGTRAEAGRTVAADWATLGEGSEILIGGVADCLETEEALCWTRSGARELSLFSGVVEDKPANFIVERYDGRIIDVFFDSHEEALAFGKRRCDVWAA